MFILKCSNMNSLFLQKNTCIISLIIFHPFFTVHIMLLLFKHYMYERVLLMLLKSNILVEPENTRATPTAILLRPLV